MIPRIRHRIWIIVSWYLLLKCCLAHKEVARSQASERVDHIFHQLLDNNAFVNNIHSDHAILRDEPLSKISAKRKPTPFFASKRVTAPPSAAHSRRKISVAYNNLDNVLHTAKKLRPAVETFADKTLQKPSNFLDVSRQTVSKLNLYHVNDPSRIRRHRRSVNKADTVKSQSAQYIPHISSLSSIIDGKSETTADISMLVTTALIKGNERDAQRHGRRSNDDTNSSNSGHKTSPAVIDSVKASNLDQQISQNPTAAEDALHRIAIPSGNSSTLDALKTAQTFPPTKPPGKTHPLSHLADDPTERAITPTHSSVTTDSHHYGREQPPGGGGGGAGEPSFILLDDSVYITPAHRNGTRPIPPYPPLPSARSGDLAFGSATAIFGGRNFDEQIIFLNGPDLLETSVEQESSSSPAGPVPGRRLMGKVPRAVRPHGTSDRSEHIPPQQQEELPLALPLRPIIRDPAEEQLAEDNVVLVYADQHETVRLSCEVDADITTGVWLKDGQIVHAMDKKSRTADIRFVRESFGALTISNVMLEDDGVWQCEAENARGFFFNGRPIKLIVLDPPREQYLLIDSRRLDAGNMFIPVKENSELTLACVSEGGNPRPTLTWEVLLSPGIDRHAQKLSNDVLELQEIKKDKDSADKEPYKINTGAISEARLPAVLRVHHNARILCIMEHPTLKVRQNASILLDVQYTPSFAITRTPGFGYPLREGIEVSLKCDVDSNPPSTPLWQKDDGDPPVPQTGDGFLNFSSIRREHSGWYKCTSRHLNFQYSSIGYYLSVRYDPVDVTSEPVEQDLSLSPSSSSSSSSSPASSSAAFTPINGAGTSSGGPFPGSIPIGTNSFKAGGQMEVELGGSVTLQCPQGSLGCWSHLDSASARLKGSGSGSYTQTGQLSLKDVVYQDAGTYKCVGQSTGNRKKLELHRTVSTAVSGVPKVTARNATPVALTGTPLHLSVEFCSNPSAYAARWLHGDRIYTPGNQYGGEVFAYGFTDLPAPHCKEARLTYVHMHEKVPRTFYFVVSSPGGVAEAVFKVNYTLRQTKANGSLGSSFSHSGAGTGSHGNSFSSSSSSASSSSPSSSSSSSSPVSSVSSPGNINGGLSGYKIGPNTINTVPGNGLDDDEELMEPEEIHFPIFGTGRASSVPPPGHPFATVSLSILLHFGIPGAVLTSSWLFDTAVMLHGATIR